MKILAIYDETVQSRSVLRYGLRKAREKNGELIVLRVFQTSLLPGPTAGETAKAEAARRQRDAETVIREAGQQGITVKVLFEEGDAIEESLRISKSESVDLLLTSPLYKAIAGKAECPVYVMPGTILVPVDSSEALQADFDSILVEARAAGSKVMLLGIVPVHLYSAGEQEELEQIKNKTAAAVRQAKKMLSEKGIEAADIIRSGYPDEEILKAAEENEVSLIMLPAGGKAPSELTKAAAILLDEPERVKRPLYLMTLQEA